MEELVKIVVWYSVSDGWDGSAYPVWFLTEEDAEYDQEYSVKMGYSSGWGEICTGSVETFIGSDIHKEAVYNSEYTDKERRRRCR